MGNYVVLDGSREKYGCFGDMRFEIGFMLRLGIKNGVEVELVVGCFFKGYILVL